MCTRESGCMPHIGEKANTIREPGNSYDRFAVAVLEEDTLCVEGHIISPADRYIYCALRQLFKEVVDSTARHQTLHATRGPSFLIVRRFLILRRRRTSGYILIIGQVCHGDDMYTALPGLNQVYDLLDCQ